MGNILGAYLMPHPPIIIKEIGRGRAYIAKKTIDSMELVAKEIAKRDPDTIILISPHGPLFDRAIGIRSGAILKGDFEQFGVPTLSIKSRCDEELVQGIVEESNKMGIDALKVDKSVYKSYNISEKLDWGVLVPLYYVQKELAYFELVTMGISGFSLAEHYNFGIAIRQALDKLDRGVVIIASGDLSHRLKNDGPYGYHPAGVKLDRQIISSIEKGDIEGLFSIPSNIIEEGGECGLRSIIMAMGIMDGQKLSPRVLSYEFPFGVGYCVAAFEPGNMENFSLKTDRLLKERGNKSNDFKAGGDSHVKLAKESLESYVLEGKILSIEDGLAQELTNEKAGVFVTLKQEGRLRGCIGTIEPIKNSIAEEIIHNAISAGTRDPRFPPVGPEELDSLSYSVDVLMAPEPIDGLEDLDVKRYGVIVTKGIRKGLLLPNLEGVEDPSMQVKIALEKAGISEDEPYKLERFEVIRHQ